MTKIVLVEKNGTQKTLNAKNLTKKDIYKKCGFRKSEGFEKRNNWVVKNGDVYSVEVWSRDSGRANTENKYELPPPVDSALYFGTIALVGLDEEGKLTDLDKEQWSKIYEQLFGGFDEIGETDDDDEEDELEHIPTELKTKVGGYMKDGFVVDGDESDESGEEEHDDEEDNVVESGSPESESEYDSEDDMLSDAGSELEEEEYLYSDDEQ